MELSTYLVGCLITAIIMYHIAAKDSPEDEEIPVNILIALLMSILSWSFAIPAMIIITTTKLVKHSRR